MPLITPEDYRPHAEKHEGRVPWMYLDSVGVVTTGIGHAIRKVGDAGSLFTGTVVAKSEISRQYNAIKSQPKNKAAKFYARFSTLRLSDDEINDLFERDCLDKIADLARELSRRGVAMISLPWSVQLALLDMAFNLGVAGLMKWPRLMAAIKENDWAVCADECNRSQLSRDRNDWTRSLFIDAAYPPARDADESPAQPAPPGPPPRAGNSGNPPSETGPSPDRAAPEQRIPGAYYEVLPERMMPNQKRSSPDIALPPKGDYPELDRWRHWALILILIVGVIYGAKIVVWGHHGQMVVCPYDQTRSADVRGSRAPYIHNGELASDRLAILKDWHSVSQVRSGGVIYRNVSDAQSRPILADIGNLGVINLLAHKPQLPDEQSSLNQDRKYQTASYPRQRPSGVSEPPFVRRFFVSILFIPIAFGCALFGGYQCYRKRYAAGLGFIGLSWMVALIGFGIVMLSRWENTWKWWI